MLVKWKLVLQLYYYRVLFLLGLKSEEIYYIGGSEALPPPLTREEEEYLLESCHQAIRPFGPCSSNETCGLSCISPASLKIRAFILRILVSIGAIGLIKAVNTFDPEKKIKLATYASRCIENEILMYFAVTAKQGRKYPSMSRSISIGTATSCCSPMFWNRERYDLSQY